MKNVLHDFLEHDPRKLKPLEPYFNNEAKKSDIVVGTLLIYLSKGVGFHYRKFWKESQYTSFGVEYCEWNHFCNFLSVEDCHDYMVEELIDFESHDWTDEEKRAIIKTYHQNLF